jgi:hypothetical protein
MKSLLEIATCLSIACLTSACVGAGPEDPGEGSAAETDEAPSTLTDPCSGAPVGHFDQVSDTLVFDDGFEVSRSDIELLDADASLEVQCTADDAESAGMHTQALTWANGSCWVMIETYAAGRASCLGCCYNMGGHRYSCRQSCSDYSHR